MPRRRKRTREKDSDEDVRFGVTNKELNKAWKKMGGKFMSVQELQQFYTKYSDNMSEAQLRHFTQKAKDAHRQRRIGAQDPRLKAGDDTDTDDTDTDEEQMRKRQKRLRKRLRRRDSTQRTRERRLQYRDPLFASQPRYRGVYPATRVAYQHRARKGKHAKVAARDVKSLVPKTAKGDKRCQSYTEKCTQCRNRAVGPRYCNIHSDANHRTKSECTGGPIRRKKTRTRRRTSDDENDIERLVRKIRRRGTRR